LDEFSPIELFALGSFCKRKEVQLFSIVKVLILATNGLGYALAIFSQTHLVTLVAKFYVAKNSLARFL
jgi:hypothetical protein